MPKFKDWIPAIATILAVVTAGVIQYHGTQAAIKSQEEKERLSEMVANLFEGMAMPRGAGATLIAQAHAKAAIYGDADVIASFVRLQVDTGNDNLPRDMAALIMAIRRQVGTETVDSNNIATLVQDPSGANRTQ